MGEVHHALIRHLQRVPTVGIKIAGVAVRCGMAHDHAAVGGDRAAVAYTVIVDIVFVGSEYALIAGGKVNHGHYTVEVRHSHIAVGRDSFDRHLIVEIRSNN